MTDESTATPPRTRAGYHYWTTVSIRYCDQDPIGHINNTAMAAYIEQARVAQLYPLLRDVAGPHYELVIARLVIEYLKELSFPGNVEVGTRIARIGSKSFVLHHGIFKADEDTCAGTAECIMVFFDTRRRQSILPPPEIRSVMEDFIRHQPAR